MNKISNWVKYCLEKIPYRQGRALDLACGKGRHSIFLSNQGYNVLSVDTNEISLNLFNGRSIRKKAIDVEDVNNWPLEEKNFYVIVVTNFLNRTIFPLIINSVDTGGYLIYETFSDGHQNIGRPNNPKYILKSKELINLTSSMRLLEYEEIYINNYVNHSFKQRIFTQNV